MFQETQNKTSPSMNNPKLEIFSSLYNFHELVPVAVFSQWRKGKEEAKKNNSEKSEEIITADKKKTASYTKADYTLLLSY